MTSGVVVPSLLAVERKRALLFSRYSLPFAGVTPGQFAGFDVVWVTAPGFHDDAHTIDAAVALAKEKGVETVLLPTDSSLGPLPLRKLRDEIIPALRASGIRLLSLSSSSVVGAPPFDSDDSSFLAGIWYTMDRPKPVVKHWPRCGRWGHKCPRPASRAKGHTLRGELGEEVPDNHCAHEACGCEGYVEEDERAMGRGGRG